MCLHHLDMRYKIFVKNKILFEQKIGLALVATNVGQFDLTLHASLAYYKLQIHFSFSSLLGIHLIADKISYFRFEYVDCCKNKCLDNEMTL